MGTPFTSDPFTTDAFADELRRRAALLRRFATRLDGVDLRGLVARAGTSTWIGPAPDDCYADLSMQRSTLASTADQLRAAARALESQASAGPR